MGAPQYEQAGADIGGTGTTNTIPRWTGPSTLGDSVITQDANARAIGVSVTPNASWPAAYRAIQLGQTAAWMAASGGANDSWLMSNSYWDGASFRYFGNGPALAYAHAATGHRWLYSGSGSAGSAFSFTDGMILNTSGNVGIGTASPASRLDVAGTITCDDAGTGLKLPATPGNADTQTLDAYKEGTFTATLKGGTSDPTTPVTVTGNYVLVGKTMTVTVYFANVTTTGAAGNVYITTDLAAALRPGTRGTAAVGLEVFTTGAGVGSFIDVRTDGTFYLLENFNNGGTAIGQHNAGTNRYLWFTATYIIA